MSTKLQQLANLIDSMSSIELRSLAQFIANYIEYEKERIEEASLKIVYCGLEILEINDDTYLEAIESWASQNKPTGIKEQ